MLMKLEHEEALRYIEQIQGEKKLSAYLNQKAVSVPSLKSMVQPSTVTDTCFDDY